MMNSLPLETDSRERFLDRLPDNHRGVFKHMLLLHGPRSGCYDPEEITETIRGIIGRRSDSAALAILRAMSEHPEELRECIEAVLTHDLRPAEERLRRRDRARTQGVARWMASCEPSPSQLRYLDSLGYRGGPPASMAQASEMIDSLRGGRR